MLKDGRERSGLLVGFLEDAARIVVSFTVVDNLASVFLQPARVLIPDSLAIWLDFLLNFEQSIMEATFDRVRASFAHFSKRLGHELRGKIFTFDAHTHCLFSARHVLSFVVNFASNDSLSDKFAGFMRERFLVAIRVADSRHIDMSEVAERISLLSLLANRDEADLITRGHRPHHRFASRERSFLLLSCRCGSSLFRLSHRASTVAFVLLYQVQI
mmetsp:Transcript_21154/g.26079  ORF Transcript_21154/g.26079 Transcript_21154/m.26079 type:complete len:215 (-) Transcript_21154:10-654(-)